MQTELFTRENLSIESLRATFDAAMFETSLDKDGDLVVRDKYRIIVSVHSSETIRFLCIFGVKEEAGEEAAYALCNRINDGLIIIRASVNGATTLLIDWYLPAGAGIGKKTVVTGLRKFSEIVASMGQYDTDDIIG